MAPEGDGDDDYMIMLMIYVAITYEKTMKDFVQYDFSM